MNGTRPVLARGVVDGEPPLVATRLERERRRVHGHREVERSSRLQARRPSHLELAAERDDLIRVLVVLEPDRRAVGVEELDREGVPRVRLVPGHLDEEPDAEGSGLRARLRPAAADDRELPVGHDCVVGQEHCRLHVVKAITSSVRS